MLICNQPSVIWTSFADRSPRVGSARAFHSAISFPQFWSSYTGRYCRERDVPNQTRAPGPDRRTQLANADARVGDIDCAKQAWERGMRCRETALKPFATAEQQTAALAVALAEPDKDEEVDAEEVTATRPNRGRLPQLRLNRIQRILITHFDCAWSQAKGSEQKVSRPGTTHFKFGRHRVDPTVPPDVLRACLSRLAIPVSAFLAACR